MSYEEIVAVYDTESERKCRPEEWREYQSRRQAGRVVICARRATSTFPPG